MRLIIMGAGGHGKVVADLAKQIGEYEDIQFLDDYEKGEKIFGLCKVYAQFKSEEVRMYPAFGHNETRIKWENMILEAGISLAKIIYPMAYVSSEAEVAEGCVVMPYAIINIGTKIKKACIINMGAIIDHDCILKEDVI